jgi:hypothetical protein
MSDDRNPASAGSGVVSAADLRRRMAEREAAKAAEALRHQQAEQEQRKKIMEQFEAPPDRSAEQLLPMVMQLVEKAAERGESEVQVYRFPNVMCSDRGRRINNGEPGWPETLQGRPRAGYEFWRDHLHPLGFGLRAEVLEYPGGMPGDIGLILTWK